MSVLSQPSRGIPKKITVTLSFVLAHPQEPHANGIFACYKPIAFLVYFAVITAITEQIIIKYYGNFFVDNNGLWCYNECSELCKLYVK